jgi:hypothetical protein
LATGSYLSRFIGCMLHSIKKTDTRDIYSHGHLCRETCWQQCTRQIHASHLERPLCLPRSDVLLNGLEVCREIERRSKLDDVVDAHEVSEHDGAVARRVVLADELLGRADDALLGGHGECGHGRPGHRRVDHRAVLYALEQAVGDDLQLLAEVDDEGVAHGLDLEPLALVRNVEAVDLAGEEEGDEVPVAVRRQAERLVGVGARRVVVAG